MQTSEKVIEVKDLTKKYKEFEALRGITFDVFKGEIFGILGPNGAGKTTTLEIIETLKQQTDGTVRVLGTNNAENIIEIKKKVGVQLQSSEYLDFLTLEELINLFASLYRSHANPRELLAKVGLEAKLHSKVKELSGGQKQRFTIASALVHKPQILFLDEPTTGLDPQARREMWDLVKELNAQGITIVITTHYMEEAEYLCSRVAIMDQGKILQMDSPQKLIESLSRFYKLSFFVTDPLPQDFFTEFGNQITAHVEFPKVLVELTDVELLPGIISKLKKQNIGYSFLNLKTATLEDVYLHLTGHEYEQD